MNTLSMTSLFANGSPAQLPAITAAVGPALIIAGPGPGSGKTLVSLRRTFSTTRLLGPTWRTDGAC